MHRDLPLVATDTPMGDTLLVMSQKGFGVVGVYRRTAAIWSGSSPTATCAGTWTGCWP